VLTQIWGSVLKRQVKMYELPANSYFNCSDDTLECSDDIDDVDEFVSIKKLILESPERKKGDEAVKFAANYLYSNMGFYGSFIKKNTPYGIGDDFEPEGLTATCTKLNEYVYDEHSYYEGDDSFEILSYYNVVLKIDNVRVYDGFVYVDVDEGKIAQKITQTVNNFNNDMIEVLYDHINRLSLVSSLGSSDW
jgi:hypothetical protein